MEKHLVVIGHGYSASALAEVLLGDGWRVTGTTRSVERMAQIKETGVDAVQWPGTDISELLDSATHLLISAGPNSQGDPVLAELSDELAKADFDWVGYLSTTGVYGDHQGGWVDEDTPLAPSTQRGLWRTLAEGQWTDLAQRASWPLHVFRLAGIYGPGRGPFSKVRNGTARRIIKKNQVFSRIHVEDIAQVLAASIGKDGPGRIYNVCDDEAAPPQDVIGYAAELLGVEPPEEIGFETADLSPMARSFYAESKRVRNDRIKEELGVTLRYPDYRSGLQALLAVEG